MRRLVRAAVAAAAVLPVLAGCGLGGGDTKTLVAHFDRTVGLYVESDVRVLGVRIGKVTGIEPQGTSVRVEMEYDAEYEVPADAKAVVVAPSIVSDRYVQLTPVWRSGPLLADGAELGRERTEVPVELDEIYSALTDLNRALGPDGANKDGALSDLVSTGAANLRGNGALLGQALQDFSTAVETLAEQREDLFGTVRDLADFTTTIANSDAIVRRFNADLADVAAQLAEQRDDLATAVKQLSLALGEVAAFVEENDEALTSNIKGLATVTDALVSQKAALEEFLDNTPTALSNLQLAYNPRSGTLDTRDNNFGQDIEMLCGILVSGGLPQSVCDEIHAPAAAAGPSATRTRDLTLGGVLGARR